MTECLENCHLCGHVMASGAPVCPGCFATSDPSARAAIANERSAEMNRLAHRQRLAKRQQVRFVVAICIMFVMFVALVVGMAAVEEMLSG